VSGQFPLRRVGFGVRGLLLALVVLLAPLGNAADDMVPADGPDEIVRSVSDDILDIIATYQGRFETNPDGYYTAVDDTMSGFVDYPAIARAVMARYWADASEEQRARFVDAFRRGLVRTYARALLEFEQERVNVLPLRADHLRGDRALVRMEITGSNGRIYPLQYSMGRGEDGIWRVRNVIVDGVNLGLTYRNQFASAMQTGEARGDIDAVIDSWTLDGPSGSGS
jgi:phospholipid transport system substrate-binding protein